MMKSYKNKQLEAINHLQLISSQKTTYLKQWKIIKNQQEDSSKANYKPINEDDSLDNKNIRYYKMSSKKHVRNNTSSSKILSLPFIHKITKDNQVNHKIQQNTQIIRTTHLKQNPYTLQIIEPEVFQKRHKSLKQLVKNRKKKKKIKSKQKQDILEIPNEIEINAIQLNYIRDKNKQVNQEAILLRKWLEGQKKGQKSLHSILREHFEIQTKLKKAYQIKPMSFN